MKLARVVVGSIGGMALLAGCAGLLGFEELSTSGASGADAGGTEAAVSPEGGASLPPSCEGADLQRDPLHCGRCGHDCLGGGCDAGRCEAVFLGNVPARAPLSYVVEHEGAVYVSTFYPSGSEVGGIWKVAKDGSGITQVTAHPSAQGMAVLEGTLYYVVNDTVANGGGLYACELRDGGTCATSAPVIAAGRGDGLAVDRDTLFFATDNKLREFSPPNNATAVLDDFERDSFWVDVDEVYYLGTPDNAVVPFKRSLGGGDGVAIGAAYTSGPAVVADPGVIVGTDDAIYYSAHDTATTGSNVTGGVLRRIPRISGQPCVYGEGANRRPYGIHLDRDAGRIYWTNRGDSVEPFANGSLAMCSLADCCTVPEILWQGSGEPTAITADDKALYWVTRRTSDVWKLAKP